MLLCLCFVAKVVLVVARWLFTDMSPLTSSLYQILVLAVHMAQVTL